MGNGMTVTYEIEAPTRDPMFGQPRFAKGSSGALYLLTRSDEYICIVPGAPSQCSGDKIVSPHLPDLHILPTGTIIKITA